MKEIEGKFYLSKQGTLSLFFSNYYICFYTPRAATDTAFCSAGSGDISKILHSCQCTTLVTILHRFEFEFWKKSSLFPPLLWLNLVVSISSLILLILFETGSILSQFLLSSNFANIFTQHLTCCG